MQWLLRFRVCVIICIAVVLISTAVIFSALRAVLPYATGYKAEIQQELSRQIGLPVEIDTIDAAIHGFSPRLKLLGVSIFDEKGKVPLFNFKEAFVELDSIASILRGEFIVDDVGLVGADISIEKLSDNEWMIQGIKITNEGESELPEQFLYMLQNANYLLHDSNIHYQDHTGEKLNFSLMNVNIDVKNSFNNHDIKLSMYLPDAYGRDLAVVANLNGNYDELDGDIYIDVSQLNIKQWNNKFNIIENYNVEGVVDLNLWLTLDDNNIQSLISKFSINNIFVENTKTDKSWQTNYLSSNVRYVKNDEHWNIAVTDFHHGEQEKTSWRQEATIVASDDNHNYYLSADFIRVQDVIKIAEVFLNKDQLTDFFALNAHQVKVDLYNLSLQLPKDQSERSLLNDFYLDATLLDLSLLDETSGISVTGADGRVVFEDGHANIQLSSNDTSLEIKDLFREPIKADTLSGNLSIDYDGNTWRIQSEQIQLKNNHMNTFSRLDIMSVVGAEDVFADIQTNIYDGYGKYAKHYLPVGVLSKGLVDWLDIAVTDGYAASGSFLLHGNLNNFPFDNNDGVFQILFSPQDVSMQFLEGWPMVTDASATLKFNNRSLFLYDGQGKTLDASLFNGYAEIIDLDVPHLSFTTDAHSTNTGMQSYIWNSELNDVMGDAMRLFQLEGESDLSLNLEVPLDADEINVGVKGRIKFIDTEMYYAALGYELKGINGVVDFTEDSIFADSMNAKIQGRDVTLNAFTRNVNNKREVIFHLDGVMSADYLLQRYEWIPENWLSGSSNWAVDIEVPYEPEEYLVHVKTHSYLEDVVFQLSDKVNKPAKSQVFLSTEIDVLDNNGLRVEVAAKTVRDSDQEAITLYDIFAVRDDNDLWSFNIKSPYMTGKGTFTEGLGRDTQVVLDLKNFDVHSMFYKSDKEGNEPLSPTTIPPLSWKVEKVLWDGWTFTDVTVETDWHKHGMMINTFSLKGKKMSFDARGTWLLNWRGAQETVMEGTIYSSNLGVTLSDLGFERSINRSSYSATFDSRWPAEPYGLSWANMTGKTEFEMIKGEIVDVDPGAGGRLLGLLNIFKLTNRLVLDFDDVTRDGFAFDKIKGDFEFVNGDGSLTNFDVSASAADINMFGSIGLVNRDYGLLMRVKPHTDTLTFAGGALLGGVVVGAGLALIQKVFDLGVIGHNVYSITGSWDDPVVEQIVEKNEDLDTDVIDEEDF